MVSILILTLNEEHELPDCLRSVAWSDDVVVLDSFSSDRTVPIAQAAGARVIQRRFDNWAAHQNWAMQNIEFRHPWVFYLDADERMTPALRKEAIETAELTDNPHVAFYVRRRNYLIGRWLKHAMPPRPVMRFFRPPYIRFHRLVNPTPEVNGSYGYLREPFDHHPFAKGIIHWLRRHNDYSRLEALEAVTAPSQPLWANVRDAVRASDGAQRIKAIKAATYSLPGRDLLRFVQSYLLRLGVLDGMPGLHYCLMISMYEYWIALKLRELRRPWGAETEAAVERLCRERRPVAAQLQPPVAGPALASTDAPMVEVVIATFNERDQIADAVRNAMQFGAVFVVDSFSTDGTPELARAAGATVIQHPFANYARQKNWAIDNLPLRAPWIFILDADERITPQLRDEVLRKIRTQPHIDGYYVNRLLIFMGCPVRHGGLYPSWNLRLFRRGCARYEDRVVHEHMVCKGRTAYLRGEMLHIRRETISHYIFKHIGYADLESGEWVKWRSGESRVAAASDLFKGHLRYRQWARRHLWHRLPGRPLWRLFFMYIVRLGFLDGAAGWHLARLMACYEYMIGLLFAEKRRGGDHLVEAAPAATTLPVAVSAGANETHAPPAEART